MGKGNNKRLLRTLVLKLFVTIFLCIGIVVLVELICTLLSRNNILFHDTVWFYEASDPMHNLEFDAIQGYKISTTPSRFGAVRTDGNIETLGTLKGNNFGYPDKKDFSVRKSNPDLKRIVVLGDSFTASQFTEKSWLDFMNERLAATCGDSIILMNFSTDGAGLANWHSTLKHVILKEHFEIDAIVFASIAHDLDRTFTWMHDWRASDGALHYNLGRVHSWREDDRPNPDFITTQPVTDSWKVLSKEDVDAIMDGSYKFSKKRQWYLLSTLGKMYSLRRLFKAQDPEIISFDAEQLVLIREISAMIEALQVPVLTVSFLMSHSKTKAFADSINSSFIDDEAFLTWQRSADEHTIKGDLRWNVKGAEGYAVSIFPQFWTWLKEVRIVSSANN